MYDLSTWNSRKVVCAALSVTLAFSPMGSTIAGQIKGPSSTDTPYVVAKAKGWDVHSILTVGDSVNKTGSTTDKYRMAGIPDGMGAFDNGDGTFTLLMNHEFGNTVGIARAHGGKGAFVSRWIISKTDLKVISGQDLIKTVKVWDTVTSTFTDSSAEAFTRFCSADLPPLAAFFNATTGKGYNGRIFLNGEESGNEGRAFAHIVTGANAGTSYQLPFLGRFSWENALAHPNAGDKTIVVGTDDTTPGQVYVYYGDKQSTGTEIEKAGLHGGKLYGIAVTGFATEDTASSATRTTGIPSGTRFTLKELTGVQSKTGATLQTDSVALAITEFLRPEDGAWDPTNKDVFYFATTDRFDTVKTGTGTSPARSRLHRLTFDDVTDPTKGGKIDQVIDGTGSDFKLDDGSNANYQMFDNLTVDGVGNVLLQEDPGGQAYGARLWLYDTTKKVLTQIFQSDPARFGDLTTAANTVKPPFSDGNFNNDEENSGVVDITDIVKDARFYIPGRRYYLGVTQAHFSSSVAELAEGGQLYMMVSPLASATFKTKSVGTNQKVSIGSDAVTFATVTAAGDVGVAEYDSKLASNLGLPSGKKALRAVDITSTGTFTGTVDVCLSTGGTNPSTLSLYHLEDGVMVDRTSSRDAATGTICGKVTSLSPFIVAADADGGSSGGCSISDGRSPFDPTLWLLALGAGGLLWMRRRQREATQH